MNRAARRPCRAIVVKRVRYDGSWKMILDQREIGVNPGVGTSRLTELKEELTRRLILASESGKRAPPEAQSMFMQWGAGASTSHQLQYGIKRESFGKIWEDVTSPSGDILYLPCNNTNRKVTKLNETTFCYCFDDVHYRADAISNLIFEQFECSYPPIVLSWA